jgi:hypothetical protein
MTLEMEARGQRDARLAETDKLMHLTDLPRWQELLDYREALRDYPAHEDWPSIMDMPFESF